MKHMAYKSAPLVAAGCLREMHFTGKTECKLKSISKKDLSLSLSKEQSKSLKPPPLIIFEVYRSSVQIRDS